MRRRRNVLIWTGFAVVLSGVLSYVAFFIRFPITRDIPWTAFLLFITGAILLGTGLQRAYRSPDVYRGKVSGSILGVLALLIIGLFCYGVFVLTKIPAVHGALKPGDPAPPFSLLNTEGAQVSVSDLLKGRRAALLIFYRGYW